MKKTVSRLSRLGLVPVLAGVLIAGTPLGASASPAPARTIDASALRDGKVVAGGPTTETTLPDAQLGKTARNFDSYSLIDVTRTDNAVGAATIAHCVAATTGGSCTISAGVTVTVSVQASLGATVQMITAGLNVTASTAVSLTVGCTSPTMEAGQSWDAHPVGTAFTYRIRKTNFFTGTQTSGTLTAFIPDANGIACGLS